MSRVHDRENAASWPDMTGFCCIVCGRWRGASSPMALTHHMPPKGTGGEGCWRGARLALCGSGTTGCHGLWHAGRLELRWNDEMGRWEWLGTDSRGLTARKWTPCHDDEFWSAMAGM